MNYQTCRHGGKPCPKVIQAIPLASVHESTHRASCLPTIAVALFILGIAALETGVPALVGAILP
jgi:hypothetical protein